MLTISTNHSPNLFSMSVYSRGNTAAGHELFTEFTRQEARGCSRPRPQMCTFEVPCFHFCPLPGLHWR